MKKNHRIVIAGMPVVDTPGQPLAAPGVLKASLEKAGIATIGIDINIEVINKIRSHPNSKDIMKFFYEEIADDHIVEQVSIIIRYIAERILEYKPTIIGLSLLTYECQICTKWTCAVLRELAPDIPIIIGGPGIRNVVGDSDCSFRSMMMDKGLIDAFIEGDGDLALIEYVNGNTDYPGINNNGWKPIELESLPTPNYDDYKFWQYSDPSLPIVDSKGCVRNCEFCDVIEFWSKFSNRSSEHIFEEMLHQIEKYNIRNFDMRSSISNGNLKEFKRTMEMISDYNTGKHRASQISYNCSFIIRKAGQHKEDLWEKMSKANCTLAMGVESVIPHVRKDLGKWFENPDVDYHLEMSKKYDIGINLMIITGYPTETEDDWEETKQWFLDHAQYNNTIKRLFLSPAIILPGTSLQRNREEYGIIGTTEGPDSKWYTKNISYDKRKSYHSELAKLVASAGFNLNAY